MDGSADLGDGVGRGVARSWTEAQRERAEGRGAGGRSREDMQCATRCHAVSVGTGQ
jgi:hypothetical protein